MGHLSMDHVLIGAQVRTHTHTHVDPGLNRVSLSSYRDTLAPGDFLEQQAGQSPYVVSLCGGINAFYAIITLSFSIN